MITKINSDVLKSLCRLKISGGSLEPDIQTKSVSTRLSVGTFLSKRVPFQAVCMCKNDGKSECKRQFQIKLDHNEIDRGQMKKDT